MKTSYTIMEVAEMLGCTRYTAQKTLNDADITIYKLGRQQRVLVKDFEAYMRGGAIRGFNI